MKSEILKILIVEDELLIAEMLRDLLNNLGYKVIAIAKNFDQTVNALKQNPKINFVFVDINLSEKKTGFDVAEKINLDYNLPFVFLTSYSDAKTIQAAIAFKPEAYLVKPFTESDLFVTLEVFKSRKFVNANIFEIKDGHFTTKIMHNDILWVKSENNYIEIKTIAKTYVVRNSLEKFLEAINNADFIRTHRSYVVNIQHIRAVNRIHIIVHNEKLPISRMHHEQLLEKFSTKKQ